MSIKTTDLVEYFQRKDEWGVGLKIMNEIFPIPMFLLSDAVNINYDNFFSSFNLLSCNRIK